MSKLRNLEDAADPFLVGLAQHGEADAFAELVKRHQSWLINLLRRLEHDRELADDLAQQTFLNAYKDIGKLKDVNRFPGWLKQIALNTWRMFVRAKIHREKTSTKAAMQATTANPQTALSQDLDHALAQLSPEQRSCVVLAYYQGMSHSEISNLLNIPNGTVKSHIRRGSEKLRSILSAYDHLGANAKGTPNDK